MVDVSPHHFSSTCKQAKDIWGRFLSFFYYHYLSPRIILLKWGFDIVLDRATFLRAREVVFFLAVCNTGCSGGIFADAEQQWGPVLPSNER